jgi:hypothetical protein
MRADRFHVRPKPYSGKDPQKLARYKDDLLAAERIGAHLRKGLTNGQKMFLYYEIASDLGIDKSVVERILANSGGSNTGITIG